MENSTAPVTSQEFTPLKQITVKDIHCDPKEAIRQRKQVYLCRIYGEITGVVTKEKRTGDIYSFVTGAFRAVNSDGERFESDVLFFPGSMRDRVENEFKSGDGKAMQFAYEIFATPSEKAAVGYEYVSRSVIKSKAMDRLAALQAELDATLNPPAPVAATAATAANAQVTAKQAIQEPAKKK